MPSFTIHGTKIERIVTDEEWNLAVALTQGHQQNELDCEPIIEPSLDSKQPLVSALPFRSDKRTQGTAIGRRPSRSQS